MLLPVIRLVVPQQDLRETWAMHLHRGVSGVLLYRCGPAKDQAARTVVQDRRTHLSQAWIEGDRLARHPRLEEGLGHPPGGPRLLRPRLEDKTDLQRDDRQPQAVHPRRVRRQHHAEDRRRRLVAPHHAILLAEAARKDSRIEPACERRQDVVDVVQHVPQLLHVHAAHVLGQTGGCRLLPDEVVGCLHAVAQRQFRRGEELGAPLDHRDEVRRRHLAQRRAGALRLAQVTRDDARVGLTHLRHRLAGVEVNNLVDLKAPVGLAPPERREVDHGSMATAGGQIPSAISTLIVSQNPSPSRVRCASSPSWTVSVYAPGSTCSV